MSKPIEITNENFEEIVLKATDPVLIDFWAPWCGPCRMMGPIIDEIAEETPSFIVGKVNVDDETELATKYNINSIPTLLLFKSGAVRNTLIGLHTKQDIINEIF